MYKLEQGLFVAGVSNQTLHEQSRISQVIIINMARTNSLCLSVESTGFCIPRTYISVNTVKTVQKVGYQGV